MIEGQEGNHPGERISMAMARALSHDISAQHKGTDDRGLLSQDFS
jgi:hypothetical protein